jgi:hypothetical protein
MIVYHNAGPAGRKFSRLAVGQRAGPELTIELFAGRFRGDADVRLNREQVRHLRDVLTRWLGDDGTNPPDEPMIEGTDL